MNSSFYQLEKTLLEKKLKTNFDKGLTTKQAQKRIKKYGYNKLKQSKPPSFLKKFIQQFNDFFVYILLIVAAITLTIGIITSQREELYEGALILIIVFSNAFLSIFYEKQKEKSLLIINNNTKIYVKVLRNNQIQLMPQEELVYGDIVFLETGDIIPADIRLIYANHLKVNESPLTGESFAIWKNHHSVQTKFDLLNAVNILFMNTTIICGNAKGVVIGTGMNTQIGQITKLSLIPKKDKSFLEIYLKKLSKKLSIIIFLLILINLILNFWKYYIFHSKMNWSIIQKFFLSSIALAVSVIPEGLLAIMTIISALGMKKIAQEKAIIKNLKTLEKLGTVSVICTDKTGTLTQNKLKIKQLFIYPQKILVHKKLNLNPNVMKLIHYGVLCNNADIHKSKINSYNQKKFLYDPVDQSFVNLAHLLNLDIYKLRLKNPKIKEFPFDDHYKIMITIHKNLKRYYLIIKGAGEIVLNLSSHIEQENNTFAKNENSQQIIKNHFNTMSNDGYKILAIAYTIFFDDNFLENDISVQEILDKIDNKIIFLGLVGIKDPIRPETFQAIQDCHKASIIPIMITGDHPNTANKIASELNIINDKSDLVINGDMLEQFSEKEFMQKLYQIKVYARTKPEHKLKIVKAWQKLGHIVAMTGDGVNDAPSIKQADIGISMGLTGTEITKQVSDIILTDDNFNTIKKAIKEGKNIFFNIKKSILFLLSCNMGEIIAILINTLLGHIFFNSDFIILNTLQILWINLITDSLSALALGMEPPEENLIKQKPNFIKNAFLDQTLILKICLEGFMLGSLVFIAALIGYNLHPHNSYQYAQTFAFMVSTLSQLIHAFNLRSLTKSIFELKKNNPYLVKFFIISVFIQIIIFFIPFLKENFKLTNLLYSDILVIILLSLTPLIIIEVVKKYLYKKQKM
ncbi:cation-translocating P-type ATPase [Candidatus Phytoplasma melaleucae]|uniref:Cation-translocating P-type ATPase n=1 Tax=Candidatus Phytoplasma melaleucae TaxID=2982630 RepID=A0ABT9DDF9_9MOLU|nr:cation-translocating P-type ATPase ['Melaleuca sp.' phytoplasma]MDO8168087.1 cation-translocating P-type ATPase ['Melaleuca sp.' phytoplasma]